MRPHTPQFIFPNHVSSSNPQLSPVQKVKPFEFHKKYNEDIKLFSDQADEMIQHLTVNKKLKKELKLVCEMLDIDPKELLPKSEKEYQEEAEELKLEIKDVKEDHK